MFNSNNNYQLLLIIINYLKSITIPQMILEDKTLFRQLNESNFDLAIVDLIANECRLQLGNRN